MIHYINIILICIFLFLLYKIVKVKEGLSHIDIGGGVIPNVPHDVVCMSLYAAGVDVNKWEYLSNKCTSPESGLNADKSNICRT